MPVLTAGRFAAATSVLALAVAMGGTGYAAVKIGGNQIKNNAITSKKIKNDTVTGSDVNEASLAKVPSAGTADSATTATTAGKVNGVAPAKVFYRSGSAAATPIFTGAGLTITATCNANVLTLIATTTKQDSSIYSYFVDVEGNVFDGNDAENPSFDVGINFDLLDGDDASLQDPAIITFVYDTSDGAVVTGTLSTDNADGGPDLCSVAGTVNVA